MQRASWMDAIGVSLQIATRILRIARENRCYRLAGHSAGWAWTAGDSRCSHGMLCIRNVLALVWPVSRGTLARLRALPKTQADLEVLREKARLAGL